LEDEYTFRDNADDYLKDLPSIATYVNGNGPLNSDNILWKISTVEDVENVVTTKANSLGEIDTKEEKPPPQILTKKGHASRGSKKGKEVEKTIANPPLKVGIASVKGKLVVEDFGPISSSPLKYSEGNTSCQGKRSPMTDGPS
jgi:hypothetical protein